MSFDICGFFIKRILQGTIGGLGTTTIPSIESDKSTKVLWDSTGALLKKNKTDACLPDVSKCLTFFFVYVIQDPDWDKLYSTTWIWSAMS